MQTPLNRLVHHSSKLAQSLSLRRVLVVPFILQISLAVGLTGWLSIRNGQQAVNEVSGQLRQEIMNRIQQYLTDYVEMPHRINQLNANAVRLAEVNIHDLAALERHLWYQLETFTDVTAVYVGSEEREHVAVERSDTGQFQVKVSGDSTNHAVQIYAADRPGGRTKLLRSRANYDPRNRPWYQSAVTSGKEGWSGIYRLFATPNYVLNASRPIYDDRRQLLGVAAVDFSLTGISQFLKDIKIGRSGKTFILERKTGLLVGSSTSKRPYEITNPDAPITEQEPVRVKAVDSRDSLTRETAQYLQQRFGDLTQIKDSQPLDFERQGERQFLQVMPLTKEELDWLIVVVVPERDFLDKIQANTRNTIWLCLAAFILATLFGVLTARWISRPILELGRAAKAITKGELDQTVVVNSTQELNGLARSFNQMAQQLRESFSALERTNEDLEVRVVERTAQLNRAKETADAANLAKSQFLSNMSHELRTPLNIMLGFTQLLTRNPTLDAQEQDYLNTINRSGEDLLTLINDVLEMSKIEAGRVMLIAHPFHLGDFLERLSQMFQFKARSKGLQLIVQRVEPLPESVCADESKLRQVLINLLGNAIKFTQKGDVTLQVSAIATQSDQLHPVSKNHTPNVTLQFQVKDTGCGISSADLGRLFEPFVQTEAGYRAQEGTGLGLPISQKFVQLMGGQLTVESQLGQGSIFSFAVPVEIVASTTAAPTHPEPTRQVIGLEPGQRTFRILVAEDKPENQRLLVELLAPIGFEVHVVGDGQAAIEAVQAWHPDLVWMDVRMPVMNGFEATQRIKSTCDRPPVIIALTGSAFEEDRITALAMGCDDFVRKPFRTSRIFEEIAKYLGARYRYAESFHPATLGGGNGSEPQTVMADDVDQFSAPLTGADLAVMPIEWTAQLQQAALRVNARQLQSLIQQIPAEQNHLIRGLSDLVDRCCFEELVALSKV